MSYKRVNKTKSVTSKKKSTSKKQTAKPMDSVTHNLYYAIQVDKRMFKQLMKYDVASYVAGKITLTRLVNSIQTTALMSDSIRSGDERFYKVKWRKIAYALANKFKREKSQWEIRY